MPENLDQITPGAAKDVKIARMGISSQGFLHLQRQAPNLRAGRFRPPDKLLAMLSGS